MIDYRILHDPAELEEVVNLEISVWGLNPRNAVPTAILHVMALGGGLIMGAYDGTRLVGLLICLVVKRGNEVFLWSHMTGTHPDYQNQGIGLALKRFQRRWALDNGVPLVLLADALADGVRTAARVNSRVLPFNLPQARARLSGGF